MAQHFSSLLSRHSTQGITADRESPIGHCWPILAILLYCDNPLSVRQLSERRQNGTALC